MEPILTADPKGNYLEHKLEIDEAVQRVLDSGWYILGHEVAAFEQELSDYLAVGHAIGTGSGTDALHLALRACGIGSGDAVITASHTSVATVAAIELAGATAVLVDIDPETFVMDPNRLEEIIQKKGEALRVRGIVPVHLYGHPVDMAAIVEIAERYGLFVVEDCAQSHGAEFEGKKTGAWGHIGAFSFYPTKNLGGLGDGGAVGTTDPDIAERARSLREYGWKRRFVSEGVGMNTRLDELQAAILRVKLRYLDEENQRRRDLAGIYDQVLSGTTLDLPQTRGPIAHVYHQYVIRSRHRDDLGVFLKDSSIGSMVHYPVPVHLQPAYENRVCIGSDLDVTERICQEILSLPMHPQMTDEQISRVGDLVARWSDKA